jgi:dimethylhistidine N-methyltransferase
VPSGSCLVEYGSGSSVKVRILLEACAPAAYVPVDISKEHLADSARAIYKDFPHLAVYPTCADYTRPFGLPPPVAHLPPLAFFPGSSIGNFNAAEADRFLADVAQAVGPGGILILGVDAKKDGDVLTRAYNDAAGVTAQFNKNLLLHVNAALGANFDPAGFEHRAVYNAEAGRIEMYLDAIRDQVVRIDGTEVALARGEALHTENSYKYAPDEFVAKAERAGFDCPALHMDRRRYFMVLLLRAR